MGANGKRNFTSNMILGVMVFVLTGMILIGLVTKLLIVERVGEGGVGWYILLALAMASTAGCLFPALARYDQSETTPILIMLGNLAIVLCGGLVMDGPFKSVLGTLVAIAFGGAISCVICMKKPAKNKKRKKRYR